MKEKPAIGFGSSCVHAGFEAESIIVILRPSMPQALTCLTVPNKPSICLPVKQKAIFMVVLVTRPVIRPKKKLLRWRLTD